MSSNQMNNIKLSEPGGVEKLNGDKLNSVRKLTENECKISKPSSNKCFKKNKKFNFKERNKLDNKQGTNHNFFVKSNTSDGITNHMKSKLTANVSISNKPLRVKREINTTKKEFFENNLNNPQVNSKNENGNSNISEIVGDYSHQNLKFVNLPKPRNIRRRMNNKQVTKPQRQQLEKSQKDTIKSSKRIKKSKLQKKLKSRKSPISKQNTRSMYVLSPINSTEKKYKIISNSKIPKLKLQKTQSSSTRQRYKPLIDDSFDYISNIRQKNSNPGRHNSFEFPNLNHEAFNFENLEEKEEENDESKNVNNEVSEGEVPGIVDVHDEHDMDHEYVPTNENDEIMVNRKPNKKESESDEQDDYDYEDKQENTEDENPRNVSNEKNEEQEEGEEQEQEEEEEQEESEAEGADEDEQEEEEEEEEDENEDPTNDSENIGAEDDSQSNKNFRKKLKSPHTTDPVLINPDGIQSIGHSHIRISSKPKHISTTLRPLIKPLSFDYQTDNLDNAKQAFMQRPMSGSGNTKGFNHHFKPIRGTPFVRGPSGVQPPNRFQTVGKFNKNLLRKPIVTSVPSGKPTTSINLSGYGGYKPHVAPLINTVSHSDDYIGRNNPQRVETTQSLHISEEDNSDHKKHPGNSYYEKDEPEEKDEVVEDVLSKEKVEKQSDYENMNYDDSHENTDYNDNTRIVFPTHNSQNSDSQHHTHPSPLSLNNKMVLQTDQNRNTYRKKPTQNIVYDQRIPFHHATVNGRPYDNRPVNNLPNETPYYKQNSNNQDPAISYYEERKPFLDGEKPFTHDKEFSPFFRPQNSFYNDYYQKNKPVVNKNNNEQYYTQSLPDEPNIYQQPISSTNFNNNGENNKGMTHQNSNHNEDYRSQTKTKNTFHDYRSDKLTNHNPLESSITNEKLPQKYHFSENPINRPSVKFNNLQTAINPSIQIRQHVPSNQYNYNHYDDENYFQAKSEGRNNPSLRNNLPHESHSTTSDSYGKKSVYNTEKGKALPYGEALTNNYPYNTYYNERTRETYIDPRKEDKYQQSHPYQNGQERDEQSDFYPIVVNENVQSTEQPLLRNLNSQNQNGNNPATVYTGKDSYPHSSRSHHLESSPKNVPYHSKILNEADKNNENIHDKTYKIHGLQKSIGNGDQRLNSHVYIQNQPANAVIRNQNNFENDRNLYSEQSKIKYERPNHQTNDYPTNNDDDSEGKYDVNNENVENYDTDNNDELPHTAENDDYYDTQKMHKKPDRTEIKDPDRIPLSKKALVKTLNDIMEKKDAISRVKEIDERKVKPKSYNNYWVLEYSIPTEK